MAVLISILALVATFYQLYLQRSHNEKSLKPLPQIVLGDFKKQLFVHLKNHGVGPLTIEKLIFEKDSKEFFIIKDCLNLDPKSYMHDVQANDALRQVILPAGTLEIFAMSFADSVSEEEINTVRKELASITLKVKGRDIYNKKVSIERKLSWFYRYLYRD